MGQLESAIQGGLSRGKHVQDLPDSGANEVPNGIHFTQKHRDAKRGNVSVEACKALDCVHIRLVWRSFHVYTCVNACGYIHL